LLERYAYTLIYSYNIININVYIVCVYIYTYVCEIVIHRESTMSTTASNSRIFGTESGTMSVPLELEGYHLKYGKLDEAGAGEPRADGKVQKLEEVNGKYMANGLL
jgi:hypothetical protein